MARKKAKRAKRKARKSTYTVRIALLEKLVEALKRRVEKLEPVIRRQPVADTPETVAAKAGQARDVMEHAAGVLVDPE